MAALLASAPAQAGTLYSIPAAGGRATVVAREASTAFGPICRRADGAFMTLAETRRGARKFGTFRIGAKPRWRAAADEIIGAYFSPGCELVAEVHYAFEDDREYDGGLLIRTAAGDELARLESAEPGEPDNVVWSPDGARLAVAMYERRRGPTIRVIDARSGRVLARAPAFAELTPQAFSPDGAALVYIDESRLMILDVNTGASRVLVGRVSGRSYRAPAWSPKGDRIAAVNDGGGIELIDPALGYGATIPMASLFTEDIVWSPAGAALALRYRTGDRIGLALAAAAPNGRPRRVLAPATYMQLPVWSPDGSAVAATR